MLKVIKHGSVKGAAGSSIISNFLVWSYIMGKVCVCVCVCVCVGGGGGGGGG